MANLNTKTISAGVGDILAVDGGIDASTVRQIKDGDGTGSPFYITTTKVGIGKDAPTTSLHVEPLGGISGDVAYFRNQHATGIGLGIRAGNDGTEYILMGQDSGGVERFRFLSDGKVGIGTATPRQLLDVSSAENTDAIVRIEGGSAGHDAILEFGTSDFAQTFVKTAIVAEGLGSTHRAKLHFVVDGTADTNAYTLSTDTKMVIQHDGNVGIGTEAPETKLHIQSGSAGTIAAESGAILVLESSGKPAIHFQSPNSYGGSIIFGSTDDPDEGAIDYDHTENRFLFKTAGSPVLGIHGSNVGIGTTTPAKLLTIVGNGVSGDLALFRNDGDSSVGDGDDLGIISFGSDAPADGVFKYGAFIVAEASAGWASSDAHDAPTELQFWTQSDGDADTLNSKMVIDKDGNVSISSLGTNIPAARLHVAGGDANDEFDGPASIALGLDISGTYPHFIHTRHTSNTSVGNSAIDFYTSDGTSAGVYPGNAVHNMTLNKGLVGIGTT